MDSTVSTFLEAIDELNLHTEYNGYTGNCANIAVALHEIALEEFGEDRFRVVMVDRPSHFGSGPDHIALEFDGKYLDSKGIHSRSELLDLIGEEGNEAVIQVESRSYVVNNIPYYDASMKEDIKSDILEYLS